MTSSRIFLQLRRKPPREALPDGGEDLLLFRRGLAVLAWQTDFSDLQSDEASAEMLWLTFGAELLSKHRDPRGVLVTPAALEGVAAADYAAAIGAYSAAGLWLANLGPAGLPLAAEASELPLSAFPRAKSLDLYVMKPARAMQELELSFQPLRCVCLELLARATPREISAFYLPQLKAHGLTVKRRIWSSGSAERCSGEGASEHAIVHATRVSPQETHVRVAWLLKA